MATIAAGRIAFWEGGSLWVFDVPGSQGAPERIDMHAHHALQVTLSLGGAFALRLEDDVVHGPAAVVAADAPHAFQAQGRVALLFLEPESRAGRAMAKRMDGRPAMALDAETVGDAPALVARAFADTRGALNALRETGRALSERMAGPAGANEPDRRVRRMIRWANDNLDRAPGIAEAAAHIALSPSRASHLFVEQTGLPFRTYLLWLRLVRAVDAHTRGLSLTEAAHEGGFADSAHMSRTFRRMFGLPAAALDLS